MKKADKSSVTVIKSLLATQLGIDIEDINNDDSLVDDLHMGPADLTDLLESIGSSGVDTSGVELRELDTFEELLEQLGVGDYS